jgi:hypothetical protein
MCARFRITAIGALLVSVPAFGQTNQQATVPQPAVQQQSATQHPPATPPSKPHSTESPVADAAQASKQARDSAPATKVYRNHDLKDPNAETPVSGAAAASGAAAPTAAPASAQSVAYSAVATPTQTPAAFEAQAAIFTSQVRAEKGKIIDIQTNIRNLKSQFAAWSAEYSQDEEAPVCWTSAYDSSYYKDWCSAGRNLKAQYDAAENQLAQEKARLEQMQEDIRRKATATQSTIPTEATPF